MGVSIQSYNTVLWLCPSGITPDNPDDVTFSIDGITGTALPNSAANIGSTSSDTEISLQWLPNNQPTSAQVRIPSNLLFNTDRSLLQAAYSDFLSSLDAQEANAYMRLGGARIVRARLVENMPLPVDEWSLYAYGLNIENNSVDLQAGMRLAAYYGNYFFENPTGTGEVSRGFGGTGATYIGIHSVPNSNALMFNPFMTGQYAQVDPPELPTGVDVNVVASPVDLAALDPKAHYRLFYPTASFTSIDKASLEVSENVSLVGANCYGNLGSTPNSSPQTLNCNGNPEVVGSTLFWGRVTLVPEIQVQVNGESRFVPVGTTLQNLIEQDEQTHSRPQLLQVQRYINGMLTPITFDSTDLSAGLSLPVSKGDAVRWVQADDFSLIQRTQALYRVTYPDASATLLAELTVISFGDSVDPLLLPSANDMTVALLASHDTPEPYTAVELGVAIFQTYNQAPFDQFPFALPFTSDQLAFALYYAGFDITNVSNGVVAGVNAAAPIPSMTAYTADQLVFALMGANAGYSVEDIASGTFSTLLHSMSRGAAFLVKALAEGSLDYASTTGRQPYDANQVGSGLFTAVGYTASNANEMVFALVTGSEMASVNYSPSEVSISIYQAFDNNDATLSNTELVTALGTASGLGFEGYSVQQVSKALFDTLVDIGQTPTPSDIASALFNSSVDYTLDDVAVGTFSIKDYDIIQGGNTDLTAEQLAQALFDATDGTNDQTTLNISKALLVAIPSLDKTTDAEALISVFGYSVGTDTVRTEVADIGTTLVDTYTIFPLHQPRVNELADALKDAFQLSPIKSGVNALTAGLVDSFNYTIEHEQEPQLTATAVKLAFDLPEDQNSLTLVSVAFNYAFVWANPVTQSSVNNTARAYNMAFGINQMDQTESDMLGNTLAQQFQFTDGTNQADVNAIADALKFANRINSRQNRFLKVLTTTLQTLYSLTKETSDVAWIAIKEAFNLNPDKTFGATVGGRAIGEVFFISSPTQDDYNLFATKAVSVYGYTNTARNTTLLAATLVAGFKFRKVDAEDYQFIGIAVQQALSLSKTAGSDVANLADALQQVFRLDLSMVHLNYVGDGINAAFAFDPTLEDDYFTYISSQKLAFNVAFEEVKVGMLVGTTKHVFNIDQVSQSELDNTSRAVQFTFSGGYSSDLGFLTTTAKALRGGFLLQNTGSNLALLGADMEISLATGPSSDAQTTANNVSDILFAAFDYANAPNVLPNMMIMARAHGILGYTDAVSANALLHTFGPTDTTIPNLVSSLRIGFPDLQISPLAADVTATLSLIQSTDQATVNTLSESLTHTFALKGSVESEVVDLTNALVSSLDYTTTQANMDIIATTLMETFGYTEGLQAGMNVVAISLRSSFSSATATLVGQAIVDTFMASLQGNFAQQQYNEVAIALAAAQYQIQETAEALQEIFPDITQDQVIIAIKTAYALDDVTPDQFAAAMVQNMELSKGNQEDVNEVAIALQKTYKFTQTQSDIDIISHALIQPAAFNMNGDLDADVTTTGLALQAAFPSITSLQMAQSLFNEFSYSAFGSKLQAHSNSIGLTLAAAGFGHSDAANTLFTVFLQYVSKFLVTSLHIAYPSLSTTEVAQDINPLYGYGKNTSDATSLAGALVYGFNFDTENPIEGDLLAVLNALVGSLNMLANQNDETIAVRAMMDAYDYESMSEDEKKFFIALLVPAMVTAFGITIEQDEGSLAGACSEAGLDPVYCAISFCLLFPETSAFTLGNLVKTAWDADEDTVRAALSACVDGEGNPNYTEQEIDDAIAQLFPDEGGSGGGNPPAVLTGAQTALVDYSQDPPTLVNAAITFDPNSVVRFSPYDPPKGLLIQNIDGFVEIEVQQGAITTETVSLQLIHCTYSAAAYMDSAAPARITIYVNGVAVAMNYSIDAIARWQTDQWGITSHLQEGSNTIRLKVEWIANAYFPYDMKEFQLLVGEND